jgi:type II secretory pathway component GspD/PulD (secretin)
MMKTNMKFALGLALGISMVAAVPTAANAQDLNQKQVSSLELNQADVREALRSLFKDVSASYTIDPEIQGQVTVSLKRVTLEVALQNMLRQVDATYRIEAGVYMIVKRRLVEPPLDGNGGVPITMSIEGPVIRRIKLRSADPYMIAALIGAKKGSQNYNLAPETSTILNLRSSGSGGIGGGQGTGSLGGNTGLGGSSGSSLGGGISGSRGGGFGF